MNKDQKIIAGIKFLFKEKPYEVIVKTETKLDGKWIPCIVYRALYHESKNRPIGRIYVRNEADNEWEAFVNSILEWYDKDLNYGPISKKS